MWSILLKTIHPHLLSLFLSLLFKHFFIVVQVQFSAFPPQPSPPPSPVSTPFPCYCPCVLYNGSCKPFTLFPYNPLPSPLWSLSACSQFQCLWLYFACLFVLLILIYRFVLMVSWLTKTVLPSGLTSTKSYYFKPMLAIVYALFSISSVFSQAVSVALKASTMTFFLVVCPHMPSESIPTLAFLLQILPIPRSSLIPPSSPYFT